jgi:hypothetical protein
LHAEVQQLAYVSHEPWYALARTKSAIINLDVGQKREDLFAITKGEHILVAKHCIGNTNNAVYEKFSPWPPIHILLPSPMPVFHQQ